MKGNGNFQIICSSSIISQRKKITCTVGEEELTLHWQDLTIIISLNLTKVLIPYVFDKAFLAEKALTLRVYLIKVLYHYWSWSCLNFFCLRMFLFTIICTKSCFAVLWETCSIPISICYSLRSRADCLIISCPALNTCFKKHEHFLIAMLYVYLFSEVSGQLCCCCCL